MKILYCILFLFIFYSCKKDEIVIEGLQISDLYGIFVNDNNDTIEIQNVNNDIYIVEYKTFIYCSTLRINNFTFNPDDKTYIFEIYNKKDTIIEFKIINKDAGNILFNGYLYKDKNIYLKNNIDYIKYDKI